LAKRYQALRADPIRPHLYLHDGGGSIEVYHVHTATRLATWSGLAPALGAIALSPDGSRLYAMDIGARQALVIDPSSGQVTARWNLGDATQAGDDATVARVNGVDVLVVGRGQMLREGRILTALGAGLGGSPAWTASADGRRLASIDAGVSPASTSLLGLDYTEVGGGQLRVTERFSSSFLLGASNGRDVALNGDGSALVQASGAPYACPITDGNLQSARFLPGGTAYPNNAEALAHGGWVCGASVWYDPTDIWVYDAAGNLLKTFRAGGYAQNTESRSLVASPDARMLAVLTEIPTLVLLPL
jgi:hypothetical protein